MFLNIDSTNTNKLLTFALFFFLCLLAFAIWKWDTPYPLNVNWDIYGHQTLVNEIANGNIKLLNSQISDTFTFNGYSPLFHILIALLQSVFNFNPLGFWWFAEFFFYFATVLACWYLALTATGNKTASILAGIAGAFAFESYMVYSPLFLLPQNLSALLGVCSLITIIKSRRKDNNLQIGKIALLCTGAVLIHFIIGALAVILQIAYIILTSKKIKEKVVDYLTPAVLILAIITVVLSYTVLDFNIINTAESTHFNLNLKRKLEVTANWYGYAMLVFAPLAAVYFSTRNKIEKAILPIFIINLAIAIAKIPYSLKFYAFGRYLFIYTLAASVGYFINKIKSNCLKTSLISIFSIAFLLTFTLNQANYKGVLKYRQLSTQVAPNEIKAANWLADNYKEKEKLLIVSEPATQGIFEAMTGINTQGGVYANTATRSYVDSIYPITADSNIANAVFSIEDTVEKEDPNTVLLILSGRFFAWQEVNQNKKQATYFNIWRPCDISPLDKLYIDELNSRNGLKKTFQNSTVAILEVRKSN